jgi:SAM-dependent methyltransferase
VRSCPICTSNSRELLHALPLTSSEWQTIYSCVDCGFVYATLSEEEGADYANASIYIAPNAIGSGGTESDRRRLDGVAKNLLAHGVHFDAAILDVGCAQGGMLDALRRAGFLDAVGMDPSLACVKAATLRSHRAYVSTLADDVVDKYDVIILSHVLEHIEDPIAALRGVKDRLRFGGSAYIEVPDAAHYSKYGLPFLDFNSEHINHFCGDTLAAGCRAAGLHVISIHTREIELTNGSLYPAVWAWVTREPRRPAVTKARDGVKDYVERSKLALNAMNERLEFELFGWSEVIVWGAGSYLGNILTLPAIQSRRVVQLIDRNPSLHGRKIGNNFVYAPSNILDYGAPIVIAALVAMKGIQADIAALGLANKVVTLEETK